MGFTPQQIGEMSYWQFFAAVEGFNEFHSAGEGGTTLSENDKIEIWEWMETRPEVPATHKKLH